MATILFTREPVFPSAGRAPASLAAAPAGLTPAGSGSSQQASLLARLADISRSDTGWILFANAPAPLSRRALVAAGINPARVMNAGKASPRLLEQALASPAIAALVYWPGHPPAAGRQCQTIPLLLEGRHPDALPALH
ncbi:hypothetical protein [Zobellella taiwanensis]|uniref:Cell division inhibitor n=1 Tax=Zobellella taiwanensis TaxID=347535 RepID=A0A2P7RDP9_9GAMM|nr:hypothetical protein [Zobellella taiwanensis]PSJ48343.1 hypothetical protein C7I36_00530 [Zobellella taiwanensis]